MASSRSKPAKKTSWCAPRMAQEFMVTAVDDFDQELAARGGTPS